MELTDDLIDKHLDAVLRASGSALRHYSMQKTRDDMRAAMHAFVADFLSSSGQYVTNDASREAALEQAKAEERAAILALIKAGLDREREAEADKAAREARGTDEELRLMRHWLDVRLWNSAHEKMLVAVKARAQP